MKGKRKTNCPNFLKGSKSHIPSQTIGSAKLRINSESAIPELKKLANRYRYTNDLCGFLTESRVALGIPDSNGASKYGIVVILKEDGTELSISLRITNHQANAITYIRHNANHQYNLSIVIKKKRRENTFIPNDNVVLDEFVYYGDNLQKVESPLSKIVEGLIEYLTIGKYEDKTGVALINVSPRQNNNKQNIKENMAKKTIKLSEHQLLGIINESVKSVLNEDWREDVRKERELCLELYRSLDSLIDKAEEMYEMYVGAKKYKDELDACIEGNGYIKLGYEDKAKELEKKIDEYYADFNKSEYAKSFKKLFKSLNDALYSVKEIGKEGEEGEYGWYGYTCNC